MAAVSNLDPYPYNRTLLNLGMENPRLFSKVQAVSARARGHVQAEAKNNLIQQNQQAASLDKDGDDRVTRLAMRVNEVLNDLVVTVKFVLNNKDYKEVKFPLSFLQQLSPVLKAALTSNFAEKKELTFPFNLEGISEEAVLNFINFLFSLHKKDYVFKELENDTPLLVIEEMLSLSMMYQLDAFLEWILSSIVTKNLEQVVIFVRMAEKINCTQLLEHIRNQRSLKTDSNTIEILIKELQSRLKEGRFNTFTEFLYDYLGKIIEYPNHLLSNEQKKILHQLYLQFHLFYGSSVLNLKDIFIQLMGIKTSIGFDDIKAIDDFIKNNLENSFAYTAKGMAHFKKKEYEKALIALNKAISLQSNNYLARYFRLMVNMITKDFQACQEDFNEFFKNNDSMAIQFLYIDFLLLTKQYQKFANTMKGLEKFTETDDRCGSSIFFQDFERPLSCFFVRYRDLLSLYTKKLLLSFAIAYDPYDFRIFLSFIIEVHGKDAIPLFMNQISQRVKVYAEWCREILSQLGIKIDG